MSVASLNTAGKRTLFHNPHGEILNHLLPSDLNIQFTVSDILGIKAKLQYIQETVQGLSNHCMITHLSSKVLNYEHSSKRS